jgi:hypothetical protein
VEQCHNADCGLYLVARISAHHLKEKYQEYLGYKHIYMGHHDLGSAAHWFFPSHPLKTVRLCAASHNVQFPNSCGCQAQLRINSGDPD